MQFWVCILCSPNRRVENSIWPLKSCKCSDPAYEKFAVLTCSFRQKRWFSELFNSFHFKNRTSSSRKVAHQLRAVDLFEFRMQETQTHRSLSNCLINWLVIAISFLSHLNVSFLSIWRLPFLVRNSCRSYMRDSLQIVGVRMRSDWAVWANSEYQSVKR